jgi:hypothetical protein
MAVAAAFANDDEGRTMAIRWRERELSETEPTDTGDTGETEDTGTTKDDSGKEAKDSRPPIDQGRNDVYEDEPAEGGCGCGSSPTTGTAMLWLASLLIVTGRRCRPLSR